MRTPSSIVGAWLGLVVGNFDGGEVDGSDDNVGLSVGLDVTGLSVVG